MRRWLFLGIVLALLLVGCTTDSNLVAEPIYQSIYVTDEVKGNQKNLDFTDIPDDVLVSDAQIDHFVEPNQTFYLHILLENPVVYEIIFLTILDTKYQSYQFQDSSTSEEIIIKMAAPNEPGAYSFEITGIKYIYNDRILDVNLSAAKTMVMVGVSEESRPTFVVSSIDSLENMVTINYYILEDLYLSGTYRFYLIREENIINYVDKTSDSTNVSFMDLDKGYEYEVSTIQEEIYPLVDFYIQDETSFLITFGFDAKQLNMNLLELKVVDLEDNLLASFTDLNSSNECYNEILVENATQGITYAIILEYSYYDYALQNTNKSSIYIGFFCFTN